MLELIKMEENNTVICKHSTPLDDIHASYEASKFGWFHVKLLLISFVGSVANTLVTNTTSYLLPSAECDLNMDLLQKGLLNAMPYLGMVFSSVAAGFLTDTFGRKIFLQIGFGGMCLMMLTAASSQTFEILATAKFFEGLMSATSISAHVTYTSEFCHKGIRDRVLIFQGSFAAISNIITPAMAWGILTCGWKVSLFNGYFVLNTWNFYLYTMSLWSLSACIMYSMLPESPKYLVTQGRYVEAKDILLRIYKENTRKSVDSYPIKNLWCDRIKDTKSKESTDVLHLSFWRHIASSLHNVKDMFKRPKVVYLALLSISQFLLTGKYNVTRLWFPQLSTIVEHYSINAGQDMCDILDTYTSDLKDRSNNITVSDICVPVVSGSETYINSIIIGCACVLPYFISGALVNRLGKKTLLAIAGTICIGATLGLRWANSKTTLVTLFSIDLATAQTMKSLFQLVTVELFPTSMRSLAMSLIMVCARIGTLVGNVGFPVLLGIGCVVPFFTMTGMTICVTFISFFLPSKSKP